MKEFFYMNIGPIMSNEPGFIPLRNYEYIGLVLFYLFAFYMLHYIWKYKKVRVDDDYSYRYSSTPKYEVQTYGAKVGWTLLWLLLLGIGLLFKMTFPYIFGAIFIYQFGKLLYEGKLYPSYIYRVTVKWCRVKIRNRRIRKHGIENEHARDYAKNLMKDFNND